MNALGQIVAMIVAGLVGSVACKNAVAPTENPTRGEVRREAAQEPRRPEASATANATRAAERRERFVKDVPGVDTSGLDDAARKVFLKVMNDELCACNHPHTAAVCLADKDNCNAASRIGRFIVRKLKAGAPAKAVVHAVHDLFGERHRRVELSLKGAPRLGPAGAKATVVGFSDFQCPACKAIDPQVKALIAEYPKRVAFYMRHFPLPNHAHAALAAEAAEAAAVQGKFWEMADALFKNQESLSRDEILRIARELKLDTERFTRDLDSKRFAAVVQTSKREAIAAGVHGTPSFFVNGVLVKHMKSIETLRDWIEVALDE